MPSFNSIGNAISSKPHTSKEVKKVVEQSQQRAEMQKKPRPVRFFADGVDHVNIQTQAKTPLGRALAFDGFYEFSIPKYRNFNSIANLWVWLTTKGHPNFLRHATPDVLRAYVRQRDELDNGFDHPYVQYICAYVLMDKITSDPALADALIMTDDAEFTSYYTHNNYNVTHPYAEWWCATVKLIRSQLQAGIPANVGVFAPTIEKFADALIPLEKTKMLGHIRPAPAEQEPVKSEQPKERQPKEKKPKDKQTPAPQVKGELNYVKSEEFSTNVDIRNVRVFGIRHKQDRFRATVMLSQFNVEAIKLLMDSSTPASVIPFGIHASDEATPENVTTFIRVEFDPETLKVVAVRTSEFPNPFEANDGISVQIEMDEGDDVEESIKHFMGIPQDMQLEVKLRQPIRKKAKKTEDQADPSTPAEATEAQPTDTSEGVDKEWDQMKPVGQEVIADTQ